MSTAKSEQKLRSEYHAAIRKAAAEDVEVQMKIAQFSAEPEVFINSLKELGAKFGNPLGDISDEKLARMVFREFGRMAMTGKFPALEAAIQVFGVESFAKRNRHRNFLQENDITKAYRENADQLIYESSAVEKVEMEKRPVAYPPLGKWVCDTDSIRKLWHYHLRFDPKADNRLPRHEPIVINERKLDRIIAEDQSCIVRDSTTKEIVLIVLRDIISDMDVLEWLDDIVGEATGTRRNIRVRSDDLIFLFR